MMNMEYLIRNAKQRVASTGWKEKSNMMETEGQNMSQIYQMEQQCSRIELMIQPYSNDHIFLIKLLLVQKLVVSCMPLNLTDTAMLLPCPLLEHFR